MEQSRQIINVENVIIREKLRIITRIITNKKVRKREVRGRTNKRRLIRTIDSLPVKFSKKKKKGFLVKNQNCKEK